MSERQNIRGAQPTTLSGRDGTNVPRGRPVEPVGPPATAAQIQHRATSAQPHLQDPRYATTSAGGDGLERKPSLYGHHRQTSVIHGVQHSRNTSFASNTPSPLRPDPTADMDSDYRRNAATDMNGSVMGLERDGSMGNGIGYHRKTPSTRSRRGHTHHRSRSKHNPELRSAGEFALHHLLTSFVAQADHKINQAIQQVGEHATPVELLCGPGVDATFDQLISALGHVAKPRPKPLVDSLMFWRKGKGEAAATAKQKLAQQQQQINQQKPQPAPNGLPTSLPRRNTEPTAPERGPDDLPADATGPALTVSPAEDAVFAERRATVSVYLVCRVLIEVFEQSNLEEITEELSGRLEEIVFGQLKAVDPGQLASSSLRMANWRIYALLLGKMSAVNFVSVTNRFLTELDYCQREIARNAGNLFAKETEARAELLILGMRHIQIQTQPGQAWAHSCDFIRNLSKLFVNAHGTQIKQSYCQILEKLVQPIAADPKSDVSSPRWRECLELLNPRIIQMLTKPRHWNAGFPLSALILCCSPKEVFASGWQAMVISLAPKLKDRTTRSLALQVICRLTWTYIYRLAEPTITATKKLDDVIRIALPTGRRTHLSTEPGVVEPLIQLIRIIGSRFPDLCYRYIVFPLLNAELITSGKEFKFEQLEPEKMVIGIRAFLAIMSDLESKTLKYPPFPSSTVSTPPAEPLPVSPIFVRPQLLADPRPDVFGKSEDSIKNVDITGFTDSAKQYYARFCEILGKITILCDVTFGGQATINEKFGSPTSKTPVADTFSFTRKDRDKDKDDLSGADQRQSFYDLLLVAVQALPRFLSEHTPLQSLISLLCTGTAHVQSSIASSSALSLKSIARQGHAQQVTIGFARFIFSFDNKYFTMSDEGMLGPGHIENTLTVYTELLQIFIDQLEQKTKDAVSEALEKNGAGNRGLQLDLSNALHQVDEIESHGLFFLFSQSRRVRGFAVRVLGMVLEFDRALGKENSRVMHVLEDEAQAILDMLEFNEEQLTVAERSRLQKGRQRNVNQQNTLIEICSSEVSYDSTLWAKVFPNLIRAINRSCPFAITMTRDIVNTRLIQMQENIEVLAGVLQRPPQMASPETRSYSRSANTPPEILIEQWRLYLVMACVTLSSVGAQSQSQLANAAAHARKVSKGDQLPEKIASARALFSAIIPLLSANRESIRNACVMALGSINPRLFRTLLESLQYAVIKCNDEAKAKLGAHHRTLSSPHRNRRTDLLRTEVTHVYKLTSAFLKDPDIYNDDWILNNLVNYAKDLRLFLSDTEVQGDWEFQRLRFFYCGLLEEVFNGIQRSKVPSRWMPFESRKSAFTLMEEWCGFSPNQNQIAQREDTMKQMAIAQQSEPGERVNVTANMEIDKKNLKNAALSAMAALCAGPVSITTESKAVLSFNVPRMLSWIEVIFNTPSDKCHLIGRRALKNLITHNKELPLLMEHSVSRCYGADQPKVFESYFTVVTEVLIEHADYQLPFWRILALVLFTLGNENRDIRMHSAKLLRTLEERQQKSSKLQDFDISISDKTTAVYKKAQFEYSRRLSLAHSDLAFVIFSEFCFHFKQVNTDYQRNMVAAILPWIQAVELQLDPNGGPTALSSMLLSNLFEITIRSSNILHNEVQALWQALATGPHGGNVQLVLDFIFSLCLDRREQNFVDYAKQVVVYLAATPAGSKVIEFFLMQMAPKNMVQDKKETTQLPLDIKGLPYVCDLNEILPTGNKQAGFSLGQISLIFLVDLMVAPITLSTENAAKIIHVALVLWDHYNSIVQDQSKEMLVHLLHELVTSKLDDATLAQRGKEIEDLVDSIRRNDDQVIWSYEDNNGKDEDEAGARVPGTMHFLTTKITELFSMVHEDFVELWSREALGWASSCPVRHLACRSFQIFRCVSVSVNSRMLADMLARLSNTIADEEANYQTFSLEILTTLKVIIDQLMPDDVMRHPQLFWTTCACLNTIHEREFTESLGMLQRFLEKIDLSDPEVLPILMDSQPPKWEGSFEGLQPLIYSGLKSADAFEQTLTIINQLIILPTNVITGDNTRLLYTILANLPVFLNHYDLPTRDSNILDCALQLANVADDLGYGQIAQCLTEYANNHYQRSSDFLKHAMSAVEWCFFSQPELNLDAKSLVFLMGLLLNKTSWYRVQIMRMLCILIPHVDMKKEEIACHGPELITPLMRLLQTDLCSQALEVMDNIMEVSHNPLEREHIRMSMASGSARAIRKEYARTQSLYGIPTSTGWSIPIPAIQSTTTRNNVHAVFYTCAETDDQSEVVETPEIEFHADEYTDSYFPPRRTGTLKSVETSTDNNMGDLMSKLDSLDDFFDDPAVDGDSENGTISAHYSDLHENGANIYDQQTAPILRQSLNRTASTSSFHNGLAESRIPVHPHTQQMPVVMNPGAFTNPAPLSIPAPQASGPVRPGFHGRSVTSPANNFALLQSMQPPNMSDYPTSFSEQAKTSFSDDEEKNFSTDGYDTDVVLSDSETSFPALVTHTDGINGSAYTSPSTYTPSSATTIPTSATSYNSVPRSTISATGEANPFSFEGMRRGMRRLTGGRDRDKGARSRAVSPAPSLGPTSATLPLSGSPRVPKVPAEYLNGIPSLSGAPGSPQL